MRIKPNCSICKFPFIGGKDGICNACSANRSRRLKRDLRCLCSRKAEIVILAVVLNPEGEPIEVEVPVCRSCKELELELEVAENHIHSIPDKSTIEVIVVKRMPRVHPRLQGKKL
jgi:hypothetical protein